MGKTLAIDARWDDEAAVWIATSRDVPGLVVEASSWPAMIAETINVVPELLELAGATTRDVSLAFRAETRRDIARAS